MEAVDLVLRKFDGRAHRQVRGHLLGTDSFGTWVATPAGSVVTYHYGAGGTSVTEADSVRLIPNDGWWIAMCTTPPDRLEIYCDVTMPARWTGPGEITVVDLDIDLVRYHDGRVEVEDEDEFARHQVTYGYPPDVVAAALAATRSLRTALICDEEPFASRYREWLLRVAS